MSSGSLWRVIRMSILKESNRGCLHLEEPEDMIPPSNLSREHSDYTSKTKLGTFKTNFATECLSKIEIWWTSLLRIASSESTASAQHNYSIVTIKSWKGMSNICSCMELSFKISSST